MAQFGPTVGIVKPGGEMNTWKRPLLPSRKLSKPERLVKALGHHTIQPNTMPNKQCTMLIKKPARTSTRILTPSLQKSTALLISLKENADVVGDKPVKNDAEEMSMSKDSKQMTWLEHYQRLRNLEFDWYPDNLSYQPPVEGLPIPITTDMFKKAITQKKEGKALGSSGIVVEIIRAASVMGTTMICDLAAAMIHNG